MWAKEDDKLKREKDGGRSEMGKEGNKESMRDGEDAEIKAVRKEGRKQYICYTLLHNIIIGYSWVVGV